MKIDSDPNSYKTWTETRGRSTVRRRLASIELAGLAGHRRHAASMDADRRQGAHGVHPDAEPLVAGRPLRDFARADDVTHCSRRAVVRCDLRFYRSFTRDRDEPGRA